MSGLGLRGLGLTGGFTAFIVGGCWVWWFTVEFGYLVGDLLR